MAKTNVEKGLFAPIKASKISDKVYQQIVSLISNGQLKPGDKIPSERELSSELGISRQSIREALNRARVVGLIEVRQGEGSFILSSIRESLKPPLARHVLRDSSAFGLTQSVTFMKHAFRQL